MKYLLVGALLVLVISLGFFVGSNVIASEEVAPSVVNWQEYCRVGAQLIVSLQEPGVLLYECTSDLPGRWPLSCKSPAVVTPVIGGMSVSCANVMVE